ncbi:MAG: metallophosphoesterase [Candidatus Nanohaloarchaea archaeon]
MKILVVGDCHGEKPEIPDEDFDYIIATGDVCGDSDEVRENMFRSIDEDEEWYDMMGREAAKKAVESSLREGREVLEHLSSKGVPVYLVPGNWDWTGEIYEDWNYLKKDRYRSIVKDFDNVHDVNFSSRTIDGHTLIGYGPCSGPEIPQYEDDKPEDEEELEGLKEEYRENKEELEKLFQSDEPIIFLSHNVPNNTSLDRIDNEDSPAHGRHYGSIIVRELVDEYQPVVSIAGHMHEGYGSERLGETLCINAGLNATVMLEIEDGEVKSAEFRPEP